MAEHEWVRRDRYAAAPVDDCRLCGAWSVADRSGNRWLGGLKHAPAPACPPTCEGTSMLLVHGQ